ncbi:HAD family hydrolase [Mycoplasma struthionis]|uniref:HAD family hydrolase n=1 Tax=Mycoplasma struthionis TaxID=538220 RepID=UPI0021BD4F73|nr:HAD family hydrolase [Mycoplasma struthionis]
MKKKELKMKFLNIIFLDDITRQNYPQLFIKDDFEAVKIELYNNDVAEDERYSNQMFELFKHLENDLTIIITNYGLEISPKGIDKGSAIKWMIENIYNQYDLKLEDVMAIGDSNNDVPMLQIVGYSYAMANSSKQALKSANYFTSSVEQNGLGEAVLDYLYRLKNIVKKYMLHEFENIERK